MTEYIGWQYYEESKAKSFFFNGIFLIYEGVVVDEPPRPCEEGDEELGWEGWGCNNHPACSGNPLFKIHL